MKRTQQKMSKGKEKWNNKKSKGRSTSRRGNSKRTEDEFSSTGSTHNDVSWYTPDQQILNDVARLPYSIPTGMPISRPYDGQGSAGTDFSIPGVLVQDVMPTLGYANSPSDPVNIAAQGVFSFVRHLNSGARNYDPVDLMIYIGALDSVYSCISWASRLYATICSYSQGNRYTPRVLTEMQNVDFDDISTNLVQFRTMLNQRIAKASQLMVPKIMPIFERHRWLFANYYIEGDTMKDQIYLYNPVGFYRFTLDSSSAGMLECVPLQSIRNKLLHTDIIQLLDTMLDPIIQDEDFNIMSGDIFKAYQGNIVTYSMIPDMIAMNFVYDENVLLQFKNSKSRGVIYDSVTGKFENDFFDITQDSTKTYLVVNNDYRSLQCTNDVFLGSYKINTSSSNERTLLRDNYLAWTRPILLTTPKFNPEAAENMVMTRGTMAATLDLTSSPATDILTLYYGSEWYMGFRISCMARFRSNRNLINSIHRWEYINTFVSNYSVWTANDYNTYFAELLNAIFDLSKFKYHPEAFINYFGQMYDSSIAHSIDALTSIFEVDNYSVVDTNVIKAMHDAALLGEYNVPRIALLPS